MRTLLAKGLLVLCLAFASAAHAQTTLSMQSTVCSGCIHDASWSGIASPTATDWIGMYTVGAADTAYLTRRNTTGTASGTVPFTLASVAFGTYELRLFSNNTYTRLATKTISVNPVVLGYVKLNGTELPGATVSMNGAPCVTTPASGLWGCIVPNYNWSGTITVSKPGYTFAPASRTASNITSTVTGYDFTATALPTVSGTVTLGGSPLAGVAIAGSNGATCNTITDGTGQYSCIVPSGWSGTVTPSRADHTFAPASRSYTNVTTAQAAQGFSATAFTQVSGTVTLNGLPLPNVALAASNGPTCSTTNTSGQFSCTVPQGWSGSITPSATDYTFGPTSRSYTNVTSAQTAQTFAASLASGADPIYFIHVDHLNTPRAIYDSSQQLRWKWDQQEPFGVSPPDENPSGLGAYGFPMRTAGQYVDIETGLTHNYYRDLDANLGRYVESDPIGLKGGANTYAHVENSPLFWTDPLGLYSYCVLLHQRCEDSKTVRMGLGTIKVEICVRRRCLWRCYDDPVGQTMCRNIPCKDGHCQGDHGVEVLEYHGAGNPAYPLGAAPLCKDKDPSGLPTRPSARPD